ncbi:MAG: DUF3524 domain-containing protein [Bacteroidota bacterium]
MRILALEPYFGGSHKAFLKGWMQHSRHEIRAVTMSARFWKWRMQGGAVTLARKTEEALAEGFRPDLVVATSMVNLPAYLALVRRSLGDVPVLLYFHENQLTYPLKEGAERDFTYGYINYLSALAADRVVFNSQFHYDEFVRALPALLRVFPDYTHLQTVSRIRAKSEVLHLGIDLRAHDEYRDVRTPKLWGAGRAVPTILWNHRWEYDKNPEAFFRVLNRVDDTGHRFKLILAGEHFREQPPAFEQAFRRYSDRILHYGYAEDFAEYSQLLHRADIVISTAIHEFFGIAIMESIYCGCHPLLPRRLTYPELIPESLQRPLLHAPVLYDDDEHLFRILLSILRGEDRPLPENTLREIPGHLDWSIQGEAYDSLVEDSV